MLVDLAGAMHAAHAVAADPRVVALNPLDARSLLVSFGLAGVFVILFAETGLLIGFFLPGDTLLALAGAFANPKVHGPVHLPFAGLLIGCPIAVILGAQVGHQIGVRGGHLLAKPGSAFEHSMRRIEPLLVRFGEGWAVFLCRFIPILRTFINPVVGILGMPARTFALWNLAGGIVWPISILIAGYYVGEKLHIERYVLPVVAFVVLLSAVSVAFEIWRNKRRDSV
jgi:membrane-associated protein